PEVSSRQGVQPAKCALFYRRAPPPWQVPEQPIARPRPTGHNGSCSAIRLSGGQTMNRIPFRWLTLAALLVAAALGTGAAGQEKPTAKPDSAALPSPGQVQKLTVQPTTVALRGEDESRQLILTCTLADGRLQDLSGDVEFQVADPKVAKVTPAGRVLPVGNGFTKVTARYGNHAASVHIT